MIDLNDNKNRISRPAQARRFIGQAVRYWPVALNSTYAITGTLRDVAGREVRIDNGWNCLTKFWVEPLPAVEGEA